MMEDRCKLPVQMELPEVNPLWDLVPLLFVGGNHDAHHWPDLSRRTPWEKQPANFLDWWDVV